MKFVVDRMWTGHITVFQ